MDIKPSPEMLTQRLKGQFAPAYLTLTSIIQGVALSLLVVRVEGAYAQFDATDWLLTIATFVGFLALWHEYMMQALTFVWVPTILDSLIPFAFLATELFTAHFVYHAQRGWLLALGCTFVVGAAAQMLTLTQAGNLREENGDLVRVLARHNRWRAILTVAIIIFCLCTALFYDTLHLDQVQIFIALIPLIALIAFLASSVPYWNRVLAYAHHAS
jgi:hypothetical protein